MPAGFEASSYWLILGCHSSKILFYCFNSTSNPVYSWDISSSRSSKLDQFSGSSSMLNFCRCTNVYPEEQTTTCAFSMSNLVCWGYHLKFGSESTNIGRKHQQTGICHNPNTWDIQGMSFIASSLATKPPQINLHTYEHWMTSSFKTQVFVFIFCFVDYHKQTDTTKHTDISALNFILSQEVVGYDL